VKRSVAVVPKCPLKNTLLNFAEICISEQGEMGDIETGEVVEY
jgi:hypothetical protein